MASESASQEWGVCPQNNNIKIGEQLDLTNPFDASVYACLTDGFYGVAHLGEFTVNGMEVTVLHVPSTKAAPLEREDVYWSHQHGPTDPYEALANHRRVNNSGNTDHLFAYRHKGRLFIKCVAAAARTRITCPYYKLKRLTRCVVRLLKFGFRSSSRNYLVGLLLGSGSASSSHFHPTCLL